MHEKHCSLDVNTSGILNLDTYAGLEMAICLWGLPQWALKWGPQPGFQTPKKRRALYTRTTHPLPDTGLCTWGKWVAGAVTGHMWRWTLQGTTAWWAAGLVVVSLLAIGPLDPPLYLLVLPVRLLFALDVLHNYVAQCQALHATSPLDLLVLPISFWSLYLLAMSVRLVFKNYVVLPRRLVLSVVLLQSCVIQPFLRMVMDTFVFKEVDLASACSCSNGLLQPKCTWFFPAASGLVSRGHCVHIPLLDLIQFLSSILLDSAPDRPVLTTIVSPLDVLHQWGILLSSCSVIVPRCLSIWLPGR